MRQGDEEKREQESGEAGLLRYEPPVIEWEEPLAAVAKLGAACAKFPVGDPQCAFNPAAS